MNEQNTKSVSDLALEPLAKFAKKNPGTKAELARRLSERLGRKVHRQVAEGWTHPEQGKRVEPKLGLGLIILDEAQKMIEGKNSPLDLRRLTKKGKDAKTKAKA